MKYKLIKKNINDPDLKVEIECYTLLDESDNVVKTYQNPIPKKARVEDMTNAISNFLDIIFTVCMNNNDNNTIDDITNKIGVYLDSLLEKLGIEIINK